MAMDRPMWMDSSAMPNASPTARSVRTSSDTLSDTQLTTLGMTLSPTKMLNSMNARMLTIITIRLLMSMDGSCVAMMGVMIDRMITWPMSSMIRIRMRLSLWSSSSSLWFFRTASTTAVLEPDRIAPRQMHWTMSNPRRDPPSIPPTIIIGSWTRTICMANSPCLRILFRLISRPMQNISMTRPMSDRTSTISMLYSETSQTLVMTIPATMYPIRGGRRILLKMVEQTAARSVKAATLAISVNCISAHPRRGE